MRPRTPKRAKLDREYKRVRDQYLEDHPVCQIHWDAHCTHHATEVDHRANRSVRIDLLLTVEHFQAGCHHCHQMKTDNPAEAHRRGLALKSWEVPS